MTKLGIQYTDEELQMVLDEVDQSIKNYCHIDTIPQDLLFVRANLSVDYVKYMEASVPNSEEGVDTTGANQVGRLKTIAAGAVNGGTRYEFFNKTNDKSEITNAHLADLDLLLNNYITQLNAYRRAIW